MKGNFNYLYTFEEIAIIYNMDASTLRKRAAANKFKIDKDIKKFGKTWLITEDAVVKYFGSEPLESYKQEQKELKAKYKKLKSKSKKSSRKSTSLDEDIVSLEDIENNSNDGWTDDNIQGIALVSFNFGNK